MAHQTEWPTLKPSVRLLADYSLSYFVIPPETMKQLEALDCGEVAGVNYLRADMLVACSGSNLLRLLLWALSCSMVDS